MTPVVKLIEHGVWANEAWIDFISHTCPADESLLRRMSHILLGERAWFERLAGRQPDPDIWHIMAIPRLREIHREHRATYARIVTEDLSRVVSYTRFTGEAYQSPVMDILFHLVLHGAHHRGQMATDASGKGVAPINTDFVQFCLLHQI